MIVHTDAGINLGRGRRVGSVAILCPTLPLKGGRYDD